MSPSPRSERARRVVRSPRRSARRAVKRAVDRYRIPRDPPNFLIIGAQKAGTRWLRHNLGRHPSVFTAASETWYFDHYFDRGLDWYRRQFRGWRGEPLVGESTPGYMMWGNDPARVAERIEAQLPDVRLLAVLRDPVERVLSAFIHHMGYGRVSPDQDLLAYVRAHPPEEDRLQLVKGGWYAASLAPYFDRFGDRLRIFLNEDIAADPTGVYRAALEHLGAEADFLPQGLSKVRFSNPVPQASAYHEAGGRRRGLSEDERLSLLPYFSEDIDRLERLLGRDLSAWRAGTASEAAGEVARGVSAAPAEDVAR